MSKHPGAVALGKLGGGKHSDIQKFTRMMNGRMTGKPCSKCGHIKSHHRWQRDGSRAGCKDCECKEYKWSR
jgi:hypothetical protein